MTDAPNNPTTETENPHAGQADGVKQEYVTIVIDDQWFGIPVLTVQDVLGPQRITPIPSAPAEIAGSLNLRSRIVTAMDVRKRLGLPQREKEEAVMSVIVDFEGELYSLLIDTVGEVLSLPAERYERNPDTLDARWREVSDGIYRLDDRLLVVLDVKRLLATNREKAA